MRYNSYDAIEKGLGYMPSRYLCDVLEDMRTMHKTRNFSGLMGSIEQAQMMASRMEAALSDKRTIEEYDNEAARLGRDLKEKRKEVGSLNRNIEELKQEEKELTERVRKFRDTYKRETKGGTLDSPLNVPKCLHCGERHTGICGPYNIG